MKKAAFVFVAFAAILASCSMESDNVFETVDQQVDENIVTLTVGLDMGTATKVVVGEDGVGKYLKWKDGDVISIGINKIEDDTPAGQINTSVHVDGDNAYVTFNYDASKYYITDARYPQGGTNLSIPTTQYMWRGDIILPLTADYDGSQSSITFAPTVGDDWTIIQYRLQKGNADKRLSSIALTFGSGATYTLDTHTNIDGEGVALTSESKDFFIVLPSGESSGELKAVFSMTDGTEYTRTKRTFTPTAEKLHIMPVLADLDDTGMHRWIFASGETNTGEAPLQYWFRSNGTKSLDAITYYADYATVETLDQSSGAMTKFRGDFALIMDYYYSSDGTTFSNARYNGDIPLLNVHSGNYPIFAVKMTNPKSMGTERNLNLDTVGTNQDKEDIGYKGNVGGSNNKQKYLVDNDLCILYYDLSSQAFATGGLLPNTRVFEFKTWQFKFADIAYASAQATAPKYNVYWAGFFNSVSELETFAASH